MTTSFTPAESPYDLGAAAYAAGKKKCPYVVSNGANQQRIEWWDGWLDSRTKDRLGHIFKKHGMTYEKTDRSSVDSEEEQPSV